MIRRLSHTKRYNKAVATAMAVVCVVAATTVTVILRQPEMNAALPSRRRLSRSRIFGGIFSSNCPPEGFTARPSLDLESYISELWYPIRAAPVIYAQGQSYCSVVKYTLDTSCTSFWCGSKPRISVRNRGLSGSITGSLNDARLSAFVPQPARDPAKIKVGGLQKLIAVGRANYWVVAAGTYDEVLAGNVSQFSTDYEWALITGADPYRETKRGQCTPGFGRFDTKGFWMFARDPIPPSGVIDAVTQYAESMKLDTSVWLSVEHDGCTYDFLNEE